VAISARSSSRRTSDASAAPRCAAIGGAGADSCVLGAKPGDTAGTRGGARAGKCVGAGSGSGSGAGAGAGAGAGFDDRATRAAGGARSDTRLAGCAAAFPRAPSARST
jgi:hypothetical protein